MSSPAAPHLHEHAQSSPFSRRPILTGIAVGIASLLPHAFLTAEASLAFAAILIALIAGIYFGFAVVNGSSRHQWIEFNVAGLFAVSGLLGLLYWPVLLAVAYFRACRLGLRPPQPFTAVAGRHPAVVCPVVRRDRRDRRRRPAGDLAQQRIDLSRHVHDQRPTQPVQK
jgi:uncharacterized membrane protein